MLKTCKRSVQCKSHKPRELLSDYITQMNSLISNERGQRREAGRGKVEKDGGNGCLS